MNVCACQFFDWAACSEGVNGDVMAARDNGEFFGTAAVPVGDLFIDGRELGRDGLTAAVAAAGDEPIP
jgi:hypothetical protein